MIFVANWKMQLGVAESVSLVRKMTVTLRQAQGDNDKHEIVICPSFVALEGVGRVIKASTMRLGAQDCAWAEKGALTGEASPRELAEIGCRYVIIGHSERRQNFGETDAVVAKKVRVAIAAGLTPIVCVEKSSQVVAVARLGRIIIAYEPIGAIGTGRAASTSQSAKVLAEIKKKFKGPVLYGGSVTGTNMRGFLNVGFVGALVGGASLDPEEFIRIVTA